MVLDSFGWALLMAAVLVNATVFTGALAVTHRTRILVTGLAGLWLGLQVALYGAGAFQAELRLAFPIVGLMVLAPVLAVGIAAGVSRDIRQILLAVPLEILVGLNVLRILGGFFLLLAHDGRLAGPFPYSAGWGDVIVAVWAAPLALMIAHGRASRGHVLIWNALGALDLIAAVTLGTLSTNGFAFQVFQAGPGSEAVQHMPWLLIPTVLVPFYLILHGLVHAKLTAGAPKAVALR